MNYKLELTFLELLFIDDSVTLVRKPQTSISHSSVAEEELEQGLRGISANAILITNQEFILKIGGALLEIDENKRELKSLASVVFTEKELWLLRELVDSRIYYGEEMVGLNLKVKVHRALRESMMGDFGIRESSEGEGIEFTKELKIKLEEFNASTNKDSNKNSNENIS